VKRSPDSTFAAGEIVQSHPNPLARRNALILVLGFAALIAIGTLLLRLPIAGANQPLTWSEAFFTATSAVTVTGLGVITTALDLSLFGQIVVLLLIEVGGIGFVAFSVLLFALIGRRIGIAGRLLLRQSLGVFETVGIGQLARYVLSAVLGIQAVGALLLWLRWAPALGPGRAAYLAIFHSISAFCNAGFDLYTGTGQVLFGFERDPYTLLVLMILIIIGALGILVVIDLVTYPWDRRLMVHTKLTLLLSGLLTLITLTMLLVDEAIVATPLARLPAGEEFWLALFGVVSARTAGLTIFPLESLSEASQLMLMVLMFVGGAPASMAGGVTLSTVGVVLATLVATARGRPQVTVFGRTLPLETIGKAVAIMTLSTLVCFVVTLLLLLAGAGPLTPVAFEVISAFSNTGYSLGATGDLNEFGRLLIALTMYWGRLGPLTLVVLLAQRERATLVRYPAERIVIG
jgi:trk system potassium uptake protein TrkH